MGGVRCNDSLEECEIRLIDRLVNGVIWNNLLTKGERSCSARQYVLQMIAISEGDNEYVFEAYRYLATLSMK